jgi:hypothetical protein
MGPHAAVVVLEAAESVEAKDFLAQAVERFIAGLVFGAEGFPDVAQLVEEDIELSVFKAAHPEFGFEVFDAEIENFILGAEEGLLDSNAVMLGERGIGFGSQPIAGA